MKIYDLVIIGSGPAGLSAAIYASRAALDYVVIESAPVSGGQVLTTADVDNYPGLPLIGGWELSMKMREHADRLGAVFEIKEAVSIENTGKTKKIKFTDGTEYESRTVIAAMGATARKLDVRGEKEYKGRGVSYCATCDGNFYRGKTAAVVGGGDTAMEDALYLSRLCEKIYIIHRRDEFRAAKSLVDKVKAQKNIELLMDTTVSEIKGDLTVKCIEIETKGIKRELQTDGVFIAVGVNPCSGLLKGLAQTDTAGYVIAGENCATNCEGIFAAGDLRKKMLRQIVTAAADGANAVNSVVNYLSK